MPTIVIADEGPGVVGALELDEEPGALFKDEWHVEGEGDGRRLGHGQDGALGR